jgi:hypothetical protein
MPTLACQEQVAASQHGAVPEALDLAQAHNSVPKSNGTPPGSARGRSVQSSKSSLAALTLGAIGVVYGDIGTSVLYAVKEVFGSGHVPFTQDNIYGILSIFFWTLTVIVSLKYVVLVLRADNHGEGGLIAMLALASQAVKDKPCWRWGFLEPPFSTATGSSRRPSPCCRRSRGWRWCRPTSSST